MVVVPKECRGRVGPNQMNHQSEFSANLIAAIRYLGTVDLDIRPERWESGIEAAVEKTKGLRLELNFILMDMSILHHLAENRGLMHCVSPYFDRVAMDLPSREAAMDYLNHFVGSHRSNDYVEMAKAFLDAFRKDPEEVRKEAS